MEYGSVPASGEHTAGMPVLVIDAEELHEYYREYVGDAEGLHRAYTESYTWQKTDIALNPAAAVNASRQVLAGDVRSLGGWALTETTGAATAAIRLRDGSGASAEVIARINLAANESVRDLFVKHGVRVSTGRIFLEVISGSVEGVLYWR